jgi:hypothetical protein
MGNPQVADEENGLQVFRVDANKLIKQPQKACKGWLGLGMGLTNPSP